MRRTAPRPTGMRQTTAFHRRFMAYGTAGARAALFSSAGHSETVDRSKSFSLMF